MKVSDGPLFPQTTDILQKICTIVDHLAPSITYGWVLPPPLRLILSNLSIKDQILKEQASSKEKVERQDCLGGKFSIESWN